VPDIILFTILISITALCNTLAQTLLKFGSGQNPLNLYVLGGITAYVLSTGFYIFILGKFSLSAAYPITTGLSVLLTALVGIFFFRELVSGTYWLGMGLILVGIFMVTLSRT